MDDWRLLRQFVDKNSQEAFAALTLRYLSLVYSVCRRELADTETAEDVTQAVFLILARKAPTLRRSVVLSGWLFQTARFAAKNARTQAQRRAAYEQKAAMDMHPQEKTEDAAWADIEPVLNGALASLKEVERECVLLRFFQGLNFAEVGAALGLTEEAARKRVARALESMRRFFTKEGLIVPGAGLAALLSTHAAKAAPANCSAGIAHLTSGVIAGQIPVSLAGLHIYQLSEGAMKAMKIAKMKILAGSAALVLVGGAASYGMIHGPAPDQKTAYRTVILTGKARYEDGRPAGGVRIEAQIQNNASLKVLEMEKPGLASQRAQQLEGNNTRTRSDGSYTLAVGASLPYNIMLLPNNLLREGEDDGWVAAADEGVSGHKNQKVSVPDLILSRGAFVTGTVTDKTSGKPIAGVSIGSYGPERPASSAAIIDALSDEAGHYRLRVAPGKSLVYVADGRYQAAGTETGAKVTIAAGETKAADFQVTPK